MYKIISYFIFYVFFSTYSYSQKKHTPTALDINIASTLKEKYPDDAVVLQLSNDDIYFSFDKKAQKVIVTQKNSETLINIDSRTDIRKHCFYDGESKIKKFKVLYKNNKTTSPNIKDKAYSDNNLFHIDTRIKYTNINFPLKGYIYKTYIEKEIHDIKYFTKVYFNEEYPIEKKTITFNIPNWLDIELKEINFNGYNIDKKVSKDQKTFTTTYTYTLTNIERTSSENNAPGPTYIYPHILVLPKFFTKDGRKNVLFNSTQDLYNWYKSLIANLKNTEKPFKEKVLALTKKATTDDEKIKNIFYWVQDNIRYIAFEDGLAGFIPDEAANVYNKKYGDCKGMANLTKQMLVEAGFDARLTWIGTKHIAYDYSTPNLSVDNHMICTIFKKGKPVFLDGTEKFSAYTEYANRIQGKQVLIENGDDFILEYIPEITSNFNKTLFSYNLRLRDNLLEGTAIKQFNGESRRRMLSFFDTLKNDKKDDFLEYYLNNGDSNIKVSNIKTSNLSNREITLDISHDISIKNNVSTFENDVYIDIDFDKEFKNFEFKKRKMDYVFNFKKSLKSTTTLKIPSTYKINQIPNNISISNPDYNLSVTYSLNGNIITYTKQFIIKNAKIEVLNFKEWNQFISKLKHIYNEQIVIVKL